MNCQGPIALQADTLRAIACEHHGYVHLDPLPSQADLDYLYASTYYSQYNPDWFRKERREQWYWRRVYQARCAQFEYWRGATEDTPLNVLDWGAGAGWFVKTARQFNPTYSVIGYEPNEHAREFAQTASVVNSLDIIAGYEDFIHCSLVLEHVLDPLAELQVLYDYLRPGGTLCVIVPNEFNELQRELMHRYNYTPLHQHHLNYFTAGSLEMLLQKAGFTTLNTTVTFPMEWFALHGLNYVKYPRLGKLAHWLRMYYEWSNLVISRQKWERHKDSWWMKGWGREMETWVKKPE